MLSQMWVLAENGQARFLWPGLLLAGALLLGAMIIMWFGRWRKNLNSEEVHSYSDELTRYRRLYEAGELSKEEFAQIREKLGGKLTGEATDQPEQTTGD